MCENIQWTRTDTHLQNVQVYHGYQIIPKKLK